MKKFHDVIMSLAVFLMPNNQSDWSRAMGAEFSQIANGRARLKFALGCLKVSTLNAAQTRIGLSLIGRGLVAMGLLSFSLYGILFVSLQFPEPTLASIFTALCFFYAGAAVMTVLSLKGLRLYACIGLVASVMSSLALKIGKFETLDASNNYLQALSFEWAAANMTLIVAAIYLSLINAKDEAIL